MASTPSIGTNSIRGAVFFFCRLGERWPLYRGKIGAANSSWQSSRIQKRSRWYCGIGISHNRE